MDVPTPVEEWVADWEPQLVEIGPRRWVQIRRLSLTQQLWEGTLPNPLLDFVTGVAQAPASRNAVYHKQRYQLYVQVAVRALYYPKLMTPERLRLHKQDTPDLSKGQIGLHHLHHLHLRAIYAHAMEMLLPSMETLPWTARAHFELDTLSVEKMARIAAQAERQNCRPSHYLGLDGKDFAHWRDTVGSEVVTFWTWAIDDACDYSLLAERERLHKEANTR